ncbi:relE/StbE family addiction module toxin (plasmid) [Ochrobactrum quorumnocens]|uniref:RelE/StbE family addiction module toxin n=1 Tax=Ochrobactrum quorumnocens TaxID=271865 RepID=A0A248UP47_9HYPH|nr:relE/StbE family addiction module toxin [[Ochrobactrum] quorumnocens]
MNLTWSAFALSDRDAILTIIEADNPSSAINGRRTNRRGCSSLG